MKLIIQIPCLNESATLQTVVMDLPRKIPGVDEIETLVIDDGSVDGTADLALKLGVNHVIRHPRNRGLAAAFATGVQLALERGADIIVNTDGDGQYPGWEIPRLVEPVLSGRSEFVVGDRRPANDLRTSMLKRSLQWLGQRVISRIAGQPLADPVSGFRAISRSAALRLQIFTEYSYTIETIVQAVQKGFAIEFVPIVTNCAVRPSRLMKSVPQFLVASGLTLLRVSFWYRPMALFGIAAVFTSLTGAIPILRFLSFWVAGNGAGHIQSLVLGAALLVIGCVLLIAALLADLVATNRKLLELTLERQRTAMPHANRIDADLTIPNATKHETVTEETG